MSDHEIEAESLLSDSDILDIVLDKEQEMVEAIEDWINGLINPLIIRGPAGVGKTETISIMSAKSKVVSTDIISSIFEPGPDGQPEVVQLVQSPGALIRSGDYSTWALYADLYGNRDQGMLVLDDNDAILKDESAVAIIMKATEQRAMRPVNYTKAMRIPELVDRGVPPAFETRCPVAILTNHDIKAAVQAATAKQKKTGTLPPSYIKRWSALLSRGTYVDLQLNTPRAVRVFCEYKINKVNMLTKSKYLEDKFGRSLTKAESAEVLKWVRFNQGKLSDPLDLRTYNKVAITMLNRKKDWEQSAKVRFLRQV